MSEIDGWEEGGGGGRRGGDQIKNGINNISRAIKRRVKREMQWTKKERREVSRQHKTIM